MRDAADVAEIAIDRRHAPAHPTAPQRAADTYVFGNEVGERVAYRTYLDIWNAACAAAGIPKEEGSD